MKNLLELRKEIEFTGTTFCTYTGKEYDVKGDMDLQDEKVVTYNLTDRDTGEVLDVRIIKRENLKDLLDTIQDMDYEII